MLAFLAPLGLDVTVLILHLALPGRWVDGYVRDASGRPLRYRLNGLLVLLTTVALAVIACRQRWIAPGVLFDHRWAMAAGACLVGFLFTLAMVLPAPPTPNTSFLADLFLGRRENPRWGGGRVDAKMYLYLVGAVILELNLLSYAAHHLERYAGTPSPGVVLHTALFSFFLVEYLVFERVHLYTYDLFAERVGFKLGWGCLVFYPFFYAVGLWTTADLPPAHLSVAELVGCALIFFTGWGLARGANLQKYVFKRDPQAKLFGLMAPIALHAGDQQLLCSGFWSVSRHVNYLGELLMATGLALSLGHPLTLGPWLYPLYYVALLFPRQADDDRRCAAKYGPLWAEYCRRVPYRIIPFVY